MTGSPPPAAAVGRGSEAVGWALAAACVLYAALIHHGIGPWPVVVELRWYEPRGFLLGWSWLLGLAVWLRGVAEARHEAGGRSRLVPATAVGISLSVARSCPRKSPELR